MHYSLNRKQEGKYHYNSNNLVDLIHVAPSVALVSLINNFITVTIGLLIRKQRFMSEENSTK